MNSKIIEIYQNDNSFLRFYARVPDIQSQKGFVVTSGWFVVKQSKSDADIDAVISKVVNSTVEDNNQGLMINPSSFGCEFRFNLTPTDTSALLCDRDYYYVVKFGIVDTTGLITNAYTLQTGIFRIRSGVTKIV